MPFKNEPPILKLLRDIADKSSPYIDFSQKSLTCEPASTCPPRQLMITDRTDLNRRGTSNCL